ncbi:non-viral RNA polymerase specificity subunit [Staphylococcus phage vB_StaM_PB50]|nr:non-viral RNA polymerase specificity subunit [Staphylococcus phage vB_StaM_PB50]
MENNKVIERKDLSEEDLNLNEIEEKVEEKKETPLLSSNVFKLKPVKGNFEFTNKYINSIDLETYEKEVTQKNGNKKIETKIIQRDDIEELIKFADDTNDTLFINVHKILNKPNLNTDYINDIFTIQIKQRSYKSILEYIVNDMNFIFNEIPHIILKCANICQKIFSKKDEYSEEEFFQDIQDLIEDEDLRNVVCTIVNDNYTIDLDKTNAEAMLQSKKIIKKDLQVTDQVNKSFLATALLQRFIIPFINQYYVLTNKYHCKNTDEDKERTKNGYFKAFNYCMCITSLDYNVANNNKLYKIVEPKVIKTKYNDRVMWKFLDLRSIDPDTVINKIMDKIIRQIVCKLLVDTSAVSYFTSVIKFSIDYEFQFKYPIKFRSIKLTTDDDDDEDGFDKFQMNNFFKQNERLDIANKITIDRYITEKLKELNISEEYIKHLYDKFDYINDLQSHLIKVYFAEHFDVNTNDRKSIVSLLAIMSKELIANNMDTLGKIVASKVVSGTKAKNVGKLSLDVIADKYYVSAWDKYKFINDITEKDNFILRIALVNGYKFSYTPEDLNSEEEVIADIDKKYFISEVSQFISNY